MYCKKLVILLVFLLVIPLVSSQGAFECSDETRLGECNINGEVCASSENLLDNDLISLSSDERYLFFGMENCENELSIGDENIGLIDTGRRFVNEFDGFNSNRGIGLPCDRNYLGVVSSDYELYTDCNFCGECVEEILEEEICPDFNNDGDVNFEDYFMLSDSFGKNRGDSGYSSIVDLDKDGGIDLDDFFMLADRFGEECIIEQITTASILDIPLPNNAKCFRASLDKEYWKLPECEKYYNGNKHVCPRFYNPVYDTEGIFYPSACWAEQLGVIDYQYGLSDRMLQFISDLWYTSKLWNPSYKVKIPNVEFSYVGSLSFKVGTFLRSTLWENSTKFSILDFDIDTHQDYGFVISGERNTIKPVHGERVKALLIFIMHDDVYPEEILLDWTKKYEYFLNNDIRKKQLVEDPIQYDIFPVVIDPPLDVERISSTHTSITFEERERIYNAAIEEIDQNDFQLVIASPVQFDGFGGYQGYLNDMTFIFASLHVPEPYSDIDKQRGLNSLAAFQNLFITISHEILHDVGLAGDHFPMGYGTTYLDYPGQNVDSLTGKERVIPEYCDFLGTSPDYYAVELPDNLKIYVGQEPDWLYKWESPSGDCLAYLHQNMILKDYDQDGEYEIMHKNNLIGIGLQRTLGWIDIDGDGITEIVDPNPYGGLEKIPNENFGKEFIVFENQIIHSFSIEEQLGEVVIGDCKFERIRLQDDFGGLSEGLVPLECEEFEQRIVNLYKGVKYSWDVINREYGRILLAKLT